MTLTQTYTKTLEINKSFRLDNAGMLYPAISTLSWSLMFRVGAVLKNEIDPLILQQAVDKVMPRFPLMNVTLKRGFFWYYLKKNPQQLIIEEDNKKPCRSILWRNKNTHLVRVLYKARRLSAEFFHAITDAFGGMIFLKTLIGEYLRLSGINIPDGFGVFDPTSQPRKEEMIDAYKDMPLSAAKKYKIKSRAYCFSKNHGKVVSTQVLAYSLSLFDLKNKAKTIGVTITEYLAASFLYLGYLEQLKTNCQKQLPIRLSLPVNMRIFYPTESLRNCSWVVAPEIVPTSTELTFESVTLSVRAYMKEALLPENLFKEIALNVAVENNPFFKSAPLAIKNFAINLGYKIIGDNTTTVTLTNLGIFNAPEAMKEQIETTEFMLGPANNPSICAAILTTGETMVLTFTSTEKNPLLPLAFEKFLGEQKIAMTKRIVYQETKK